MTLVGVRVRVREALGQSGVNEGESDSGGCESESQRLWVSQGCVRVRVKYRVGESEIKAQSERERVRADRRVTYKFKLAGVG